MDIDEAAIGTWPNVAIETGSDPKEVMRKYGVNEHTLRTACYDYERRIEELEELVKVLWLEIDFTHSEWSSAPFRERIEALGIEVD